MLENKPYRLQASLGKGIKLVDKDDFKATDLLLATITKVNYQYQTVELKTNRAYGGKVQGSNGEFSAPFPKSFMGRTPEGSLFGTTPLIVPGTTALVGFIDSDLGKPIILNIYGSPNDNNTLTNNPLESGDFSNEDIFKYGSVIQQIYPSLTYDFLDGEGSLIKTFNGKTFLSMSSNEDEREQATDFGEGTDYEDLYPSYYNNGTEIEPREQRAPNVLFKHQGAYNEYGEEDTHITTFHITEDGTVRLSIMNKATQERTTQEMDKDGNYRIKYQGDDLILDEAQVWLEYGINKLDQSFYIKNPKHSFEFTEDGLYIDEKPILDSLDDNVNEAVKNLEEIQKGLDEVNYLLEGVGKENLKELIQSTKDAISASNKATTDVQTIRNDLNTTIQRTENAITKYDTFINTTYKNYTSEMDDWRTSFVRDFNTFSSTVNTVKNQYDTLVSRIKNLEDKFTENTIIDFVKNNFIKNKSDLIIIQNKSYISGEPLPTIILTNNTTKTNLGSTYDTIINNIKGTLGAIDTEENRIKYLNSNLKTLRQTDLKKLLGSEVELVVQYKDDAGVKQFTTTNYELLYNNKMLPLDNTQQQINVNGIISKFKINYKLNGEPIEDKGFVSTDW